MQVNIYEAKTKLSQLVAALPEEKEIIIARNGKPVAKLIPFEQPTKRPLGLLKGNLVVPDDIDACNEEILEMFGL